MYNIESNAFLFIALDNLCQNQILQRLVDNGQAVENDGIISVPFYNIYELDEIEMEMVGLPPLFPFEISIERNNTHIIIKNSSISKKRRAMYYSIGERAKY